MGEVIEHTTLKHKYNGNFDPIITLDQLRVQVMINSICMTNTINHAELECGVHKRSIFRFLQDQKITIIECDDMRRDFKQRKIHVKLRFHGR